MVLTLDAHVDAVRAQRDCNIRFSCIFCHIAIIYANCTCLSFSLHFVAINEIKKAEEGG